MKAIAPNGNKAWKLQLTPDEYGNLLPTTSQSLKRLAQLSIGKPFLGKFAVEFDFWGELHLKEAIEVCRYEGLTLEG